MHFKNKYLNFLKVELILIAKVNLKKLLSCKHLKSVKMKFIANH